MKQCDRIVRQLEDYGSITNMEAIQDYGIMQLASRVPGIKKAGFPIRSETDRGKNRYGGNTSYARYYMVKKEGA